jgi:transposase
MPSLAELLHLPPGFAVVEVVPTASALLVTLASQAVSSPCPRCHISSTSRHSSYRRSLRDLACGGQAVCLQVITHKWRCRVATCPQHVFAERLDPLAQRSARMTSRLLALVQQITLATSGRAASRLAAAWGLPMAPVTLLHTIMRLPTPIRPPPREIGVDEFALRRGKRGQGHQFGTIIVDLLRHEVIDLLPDREVATVVAWLSQHPTIDVVSRDRSGTFAQAITTALPNAQQVLDRFHLLQNLRDVLERFFLTKRHLLRDLARSSTSSPRPVLLPEQVAQQDRVERWSHLYHQIHALAAKRVNITTIAHQLQVSRPTVYRYLHMTTPPSPKQPRASQTLDPFISYLLQRWNDGVRNAHLLWREVVSQGYTHSVSTVGRFVKLLRRESTLPFKFKQAAAAPVYDVQHDHRPKAISAIQAARMVICRPEQRDQHEHEWLHRLRTADGEIDRMCQLAEQFCVMVRTRGGDQLDTWVTAVQDAHLPILYTFVKALLKEASALRAGLTRSTSQGQTEGFVHKLKLIKRQGFGRAGFALLRQRVLHAA